MSAPFIIPFNHQPVSTSIKTSAYTIPSGKYARVIPLNWNGTWSIPNNSNGLTYTDAGFDFNGSIISTQNYSVTYSMTSSSQANRINYIISPAFSGVNCNYYAYNPSTGTSSLSTEHVTGSSTLTYGASGSGTAGSYYAAYTLIPKINRLIIVSYPANNISQTFRGMFSCEMAAEPFWVTEGDVLNSNGYGSFLIEEYNKIS